MRLSSFILTLFLFSVTLLRSQVLAPAEVKDDGARSLQQKYFLQLKDLANEVNGHSFPYHFYFSRVLDLTERQQQSADQRAIQFDHFHDKLILKVTGNYFASYSTESMDRAQRARETFTQVMMPILQAAVTRFQEADVPDEYAFEISHHVRKKVLGVETEGVENVVLVVPKQAANELVAAGDEAHQNVALLKAFAFVDGKSMTFWPTYESVESANAETKHVAGILQPVSLRTPVAAASIRDTAHEASPNLDKLQEQYRPDLDRMVRELDSQAHFVAYAAPAFIEFHKGRYLQLSITTTLSDPVTGSQYQTAALSFDKHVAHLIRSVMSYVKDAQDFDGIDFSTTATTPGSDVKLAVEYLFPLSELKKYADYDCTGQQLLDASFVLINGERVGLNLQAAEAR